MIALAKLRTALVLAVSLGVSAATIPSAEAAVVKTTSVSKFVKQTLIVRRPGLGPKTIHKNVSFVPPGCFVQKVKKWRSDVVLVRTICK